MAARIDAHQHFWRYSPDTHGWIDDSMAVLERDFLPDDLRSLLSAEGFEGSIAVQAQTNIAETEWLLSLTDEHAFIRGVIGWVDLTAPDVERDLERLSADPKLVGVRHVVQSEADGFMGRADFRRGVALLERYGLAYDVLIYERQLPEAVDFVRSLPSQRFVANHMAKPDIKSRSFDGWARGIRDIAAHDNVWCKLSGMVTEAEWSNWTDDDFMPYLDVVLEAFGAERCMIGSDWPVCTLAGSYAEVIGIVRDHVGRLSTREQDLILGAAAAAFYGLD